MIVLPNQNYRHAKRNAGGHCGACVGAHTGSRVWTCRGAGWPGMGPLAFKTTNPLTGALRAALRSAFLFATDVFMEMVRSLRGAARGHRVAPGAGRHRRSRTTRQLAGRDHSPNPGAGG